MATTLKLNDVAEVKLANTFTDQLALNIRHYLVAAVTGGSATDQEAADQLASLFKPSYNALCNAASAFFGAQAQVIRPVTTLPAHSTAPAAANGITGAALPRQDCGLITLRTNLVGRANRGRFYVPFPSTIDNLPSGEPVPGYVIRLGTMALVILQTVTVGGAGGGTAQLTPVIFHRKTGLVTSLVNFVVRTSWATQRRRGSFGRPNAAPW